MIKKHGILPSLGCTLSLVLVCGFGHVSAAPLWAQDTLQNTQNEESDSETGTIVYGQDFIQQQSGVVNVADLVNRIPGGSDILRGNNGNGNGNSRGFSTGNDRILIDGRRLSGKQNNSRSVLSQMPIEQVERIELIRGASPDIKVSSQDAMINIVLKDDAKGSGTFEVYAREINGENPVGGEISYTSKAGALDYTLNLRHYRFRMKADQVDRFFDASGALTGRQEEDLFYGENGYNAGVNLTYTLKNEDQIHLNGIYQSNDSTNRNPGLLYDPLVTAPTGESLRIGSSDLYRWEIGGDYETQLSENLTFKIIALHSTMRNDFLNSEDELIENNVFTEDFLVDFKSLSTESIVRGSVTWDMNSSHTFEFGTELSLNKRDNSLAFSALENGVLVLQDVAAADVIVKETRDESFINHSWTVNEKITVDSALTFEYSELKQKGSFEQSRTFNYLKPTVDVRYRQTPNDLFQVSVRRNISQLNFGDFASSVTGENDVVGGNDQLAPERSWKFEASYDHSFASGDGNIKPSVFYETFSSKLAQIETSPGVSGVGDAGSAFFYGAKLDTSFKMGFMGLPNVQVSLGYNFQKHELTDPFTGEKAPFNYRSLSHWMTYRIRHEIPAWGMAWELDGYFDGNTEYRDIDEFRTRYLGIGPVANFKIEKQISGNLILTLAARRFVNINMGGFVRHLYAGGRAGGVLTGRHERVKNDKVRYVISLRGTF